MGQILKILFFLLLALILLAIVLPLLWLVIKEANGLYGDFFASLGDVSENIGYIVFTIICIGFIIWVKATWD